MKKLSMVILVAIAMSITACERTLIVDRGDLVITSAQIDDRVGFTYLAKGNSMPAVRFYSVQQFNLGDTVTFTRVDPSSPKDPNDNVRPNE